MKKYLSVFILPFISTLALAQAPSAVISIGGGINTTSSTLKKEALIGNGYLINTNVFVPFLSKGWDGSVKGSGKFALGIIAGAEYNSAKNLIPGVGSTQKLYKLYTGDLDITNNQKGSANSSGFTGLAGLQADFTLGKVTLSPSVSGAYFSLKQDGFAQSSQVMVNGKTQNVVLLESASAKRTGFIFKPQFKVSYPISGNLSFYAAGGLNIGPKITTTQSRLVPAGGFTDKNMYEPTQLATGTREDHSLVSRYQTIAVTAGISWGFGGGSESRRRYRGKVTKPGDGGMRYTGIADEPSPTAQATTSDQRTYTGGRKNEPSPTAQAATDDQRTYTAGHRVETSALAAGSPIGGVTVKGGKNPGGNMISIVANNNGEIELKGLEAGDYKFTITAPEEPAAKGHSEKGIKRSEGAESNRLSMTPTTTKQTQGANFGEKVAGGLQSGAGALSQGASKSINEKGVSSTKGRPKNMVFSPGNPIGGIIVKGGKNPGGSTMVITTNDNGEFELNGIEAGDYKFMVTAPTEPSDSQTATDEQRTYTAGHRNETNALAATNPNDGNATEAKSKGTGIGGMAKPGGAVSSSYAAGKAINSNSDGKESQSEGIKNPEQMVADEHRTYTGGRKNEPSALVAGQPIKGVIVKGGKNPGGNMMTIVTGNNGEIELNGLEAGDYKFTVTAPEEPAGKSIREKGVKRSEDATSDRLSMTPTSTKQTQGASFGEKVAGGLQSGAGALSQGASKSINEKGVSSTKGRPNNMVFSPGSPIGGIVVKGGKNPGGNMMVITTNDKGEFELKGIEAGDYKFTITTPKKPAAKGHSEKGIK